MRGIEDDDRITSKCCVNMVSVSNPRGRGKGVAGRSAEEMRYLIHGGEMPKAEILKALRAAGSNEEWKLPKR